ncbi:hypothetical protein SUDANB140_04487 [Streptomyces sp. enrichment culture]
MDRDDQSSFTQYLRGATHREVRNAILGRQVAFGRQSGAWGQLSCSDTRSDVISEGDINQLRPLRVKVRNSILATHTATVSMPDLQERLMSYT